jgi:hypothetical protein
MKFLANFENHFSIPIRRPYSAVFDPENIFTLQPMRADTAEHESITMKRILRRFSGSIFKISKEFHRSNEKVYICTSIT